MEFEELWIQTWKENIEGSKSRIYDPLIVHHPSKNQLLVNFHMDLLQLMRETRYLQTLGIQVPQSAIDVALQVVHWFI